jgi:hypothetical protein
MLRGTLTTYAREVPAAGIPKAVKGKKKSVVLYDDTAALRGKRIGYFGTPRRKELYGVEILFHYHEFSGACVVTIIIL